MTIRNKFKFISLFKNVSKLLFRKFFVGVLVIRKLLYCYKRLEKIRDPKIFITKSRKFLKLLA